MIVAVSAFFALVSPTRAEAQRYLPGQLGVQVTGGFVDGFTLVTGDDSKRFYGSIGLARYNRNRTRWLFSVDYLQKDYLYKDLNIPKTQITAEAGYYVPFASNRGKDFHFSIGASGLAGYESVNWNEKLLFDGATIRDKDCFIYGFSVGFEAEVFVADRIILLVSAKERFAFGSSIKKTHTLVGFGIKFLID